MDVASILLRAGYVNLQDFGKEYRTSPLYRASDNRTSLCIDKRTGQWYDFSAREGGSLLGLVKMTMNLPSMEAAKTFVGDSSIVIEEPSRHRYELSETKKFDKELLLKLKKDHSYWSARNVSQRTVEMFQGGITYNGRMCFRYVFPIFDDRDELVGFSGRRLNNNSDYPKWKHIGAKSGWCYPLKWNKEILVEQQEVILVESIGDMLSLWESGIKNTLVTFGVDIGIRIVELLLKIDARRVLVAFNNDIDNDMVGNRAAEDGCAFLRKHFDSHQVITAIPAQKDFGEMTAEQIDIWKHQFQIQS